MVATNSTILNIIIRGDAAGAIKELNAAGAAAGAAANKWDAAGRKMQSIGAGMTAGITVPLLAIGAASVQAASNLNEQLSKAQVVFGQSSAAVDDFAEHATDAFGLSERAALEAAGNFGNMAVSLGVTQSAAAEMSTTLTGLGGDLASFNNIGTDEALEKLRSGLAGEVEPLRQLGVSFTAVQVQAAAMNIAIADGRDTVTEADKVLARYHLIVEQTGTAQGDFARTSDSFANSQRRASAELENSAAAIGQRLLPVAADAAGQVANLAGAFANLPSPVQDTLVKVGLLAAALGPLTFVTGKVISGFSNATSALRSLSAQQVIAAAGVGVLVAAFVQYERHAAQAAQRTDDYAAAISDAGNAQDRLQATSEAILATLGDDADILDRASVSASDFVAAVQAGGDTAFADARYTDIGALQEWVGRVESGRIQADDFSTALADAVDSGRIGIGDLQRLGFQFERLGDQIDSGTAAAEHDNLTQIDLARSAYATATSLDDFAASAEAAANAVGDTATASADLATAAGDVSTTSSTAAGATDAMYGAMVNASTAASTYLQSLQDLQEQFLGMQDAQIAMHQAIDDANAAILENGATLDLNTQQGRDNTEAVDRVVGAYGRLAQQQEDAGASTAEVNGTLAYGRQVVADLLQQLGASPEVIAEYTGALADIPTNIATEVKLIAPSTADAENVGKDIVGGVAHGVDLNAGSLAGSMRGLVTGALSAARAAAGISSPSRVFAIQVGKPIGEGLAQGILDSRPDVQSAVDTVMQSLERTALDHVSSLTSGIGALLARQSAFFAQDDAAQRLGDVRTEQANLPTRVANAELRLAQARVNGTASEITDAEKELADARARGATIDRDVMDAERGLERANLDAIRTQQALLEAGRDWINQGPEAIENFRLIAAQADVSAEAIEEMVAQMESAAYTSAHTQLASPPLSSAAAGTGAPAGATPQDIAAAGEAAIFQTAAFGVFRQRIADSILGQVATFLSGGDQGRWNQIIDQYTEAYGKVAFGVDQATADSLVNREPALAPDEFTAAANAMVSAAHRRAGGPTRRGVPYIVGEDGPEVRVFDDGGGIRPLAGTRAGGGTTNNYFTVNPPPGSDGEQIVAAIDRYVRRGGNIPASIRGGP